MNNENVDTKITPETITEATKTRKSFSIKKYRAFLINALRFQTDQYKQWAEIEDKCHNLLRKNPGKAQLKTLKVELLKIKQQRQKIKTIIDNITVSIQSLNEYEHIASISYKLSNKLLYEQYEKYFKHLDEKDTTDE